MEQHEIQCIEQRTRKYTKYEYTYNFMYNFTYRFIYTHRSQWPRGLRRSSAAARLLRLWVLIPPAAWMSIGCECCVRYKTLATGRSFIQRNPIECGVSYWMWSWSLSNEDVMAQQWLLCLIECDREASVMRRSWPSSGCCVLLNVIVKPQ